MFKRLLFVVLVLVLVFSTTAFATSEAGVEPVEVDGNPLSGKGADNHKVEGTDDGSIEIPCDVYLEDLGPDYPDVSENETVEVHYTISEDGKYLSWSSKDKIAEVVVKGGPSANVYYYYDGDGNYLGLWDEDNGVWYDSGLHAPANKKGRVPEISNFGFFARCPETGNGNGDNGNGTNGPPELTGGVYRISAKVPTALPQTDGNLPLIAITLSVIALTIGIFVGIRTFKR
jgi:hypothetical protein